MKIFLKSISLLNFKGIRNFEVTFSPTQTNIYGDNATGKTTVFDAFLWLLFNKDSTDRKDFEIKTLGPDNQPFHRMDHEVSAEIEVDGQSITLRKTFAEKWTKRRGAPEPEFTGHETNYYWNGVPQKQNEFQGKVASIVDEQLFKLLTNATYFNSVMKWQDRRDLLLDMAGIIDDSQILDQIWTAENQTQVAQLRQAFANKKTEEDVKKELAVRKKKLRDELDLIPARIDEAQRSIPDPVDYDSIEAKMSEKRKELEVLEGVLYDRSKQAKAEQAAVAAIHKEIQDLRTRGGNIEFDLKNQLADRQRKRKQQLLDKKAEFTAIMQDIARKTNGIKSLESQTADIERSQVQLRNKWAEINGQTLEFNDNDFHCPACKRAYETSDTEAKKAELLSNFNADKAKKLESINSQGASNKKQIEQLNLQITGDQQLLNTYNRQSQAISIEIQDMETRIKELEAGEQEQFSAEVAANADLRAVRDRLEELDVELQSRPDLFDNSEIIRQKNDISGEIMMLTTMLGSRDARDRAIARIEELQKQEGVMARELASVEATEFIIEQFTEAKMNALETAINGKFRIARFKLFEAQINGGQTPTCVTLVNGVPYQDANTAAKIQVGLDIISTLCEHYNVYAPVFIDNRESVVSIPDCDSQLINLFVSPADKKLRVEVPELLITKAVRNGKKALA